MRGAPAPALLLLIAACSGGPELVEVKVMTMNLRHDVDWWEDRFPLIADEIVRLEPDLIGLQEVEIGIEQAKVLAEMIRSKNPELTYEYHEQLKTQLAAITGEGIAIFSRHPIVERQMEDLSYGRPAIFDRIRIADRLTIDHYNTHLHNEGGDEVRRPQMELLLDFVKRNDRGHVTVLTGDMNAKPDSQAISAALEAGMIDTFQAVHGEETERVGNTSPIKLAQEHVAQRTMQRIDYVFMEAPPSGRSVTVVSSTVAFDRPSPVGLYPSDHLGVMTTIEIDLATFEE